MTPSPYMNEDGDWWVPVEDAPSLAAARGRVLYHLSYEIPEEGRLAYLGKHITRLCDGPAQDAGHEVGPDCYDGCDRNVLAYHFQERRLW